MMKLDNFIKVLIQGRTLIVFFCLGFLAFSVFYSLFIYHPIFVSDSKVMLEEIAPITFVAELGKGRNLETNSQEKNPILTQMEVLTSQDMAKRIFDALLSQHVFKSFNPLQKESYIQEIKDSLKLKTPPATDIIEIKVAWLNPEMSYLINKTLLEEYRKYNIGLNRESNSQAKKFIQEQLQRSTLELKQIRERIRDFKKTNASIDLATESSLVAKELEDMQDNLFNLNSQISYHDRKVKEYLSKLHINTGQINKTLESVALGQNSNLLNLYRDLNTAEQQYASLRVRYPETTKKVSTQKGTIDEISKQIRKQTLLTAGSGAYQNKILIQDSVRTQLVNDLISNQAEKLSNIAKRKSLLERLEKLQLHQQKIPKIQAHLVSLTDQETNLTSIINALTTKLVEANVRESGIVSNVNIVQFPTFPQHAAFPSQSHLVLMMSFLGFTVGCFVVLARHYLLDVVTHPSEVEALLNSPILGVLTNSHTNRTRLNLPKDQELAVELEKIVTALKLSREDKNMNVFGFTSLNRDITSSNIISAVARLLSECSQQVLIIDTDFREGNIAREFELERNYLPDFGELLLDETQWEHIAIRETVPVNSDANVTTSLHFTENKYVANIDNYTTKVEAERSIYLITHKGEYANPYQLMSSKYLPHLIEQARNKFDYVLLNLPSFEAFSDVLVISRTMHNLVAICPDNMGRSQLISMHDALMQYDVKILGLILLK